MTGDKQQLSAEQLDELHKIAAARCFKGKCPGCPLQHTESCWTAIQLYILMLEEKEGKTNG